MLLLPPPRAWNDGTAVPDRVGERRFSRPSPARVIDLPRTAGSPQPRAEDHHARGQGEHRRQQPHSTAPDVRPDDPSSQHSVADTEPGGEEGESADLCEERSGHPPSPTGQGKRRAGGDEHDHRHDADSGFVFNQERSWPPQVVGVLRLDRLGQVPHPEECDASCGGDKESGQPYNPHARFGGQHLGGGGLVHQGSLAAPASPGVGACPQLGPHSIA